MDHDHRAGLIGALIVVAAGGAIFQLRRNQPLPKPEYLARGNARCAQFTVDARALTSTLTLSFSFDQWPDLYAPLGDLLDTLVADLRALPSPDGDAETLESLYDDTDKLAALAHGVADAARDGDRVAAGKARAELESLNRDTNRRFNAYGLDKCDGS